MIASVAATALNSYLLVPGVILLLTGLYLVVWAALGRGRWCRRCKKFSIFHTFDRWHAPSR
jgi:hypothetical protein